MSRIFITLSLVAAFVFTSCNNKTNGSNGDNDSIAADTIGVDTLVTDTLSYHYSDKKATVDLFVDMPQGDDELSKAIAEFIATDIDTIYPEKFGEDDGTPVPSYRKEAGSGQKMIDFYGQHDVKVLQDMWTANEEYKYNDMPYNLDYSLCKIAETDKYVTYCRTIFAFIGGAHGSTTSKNFTFIKPTGKQLSYIIDKSKVKALQPLIRKGVKSYLSCGGMEDVTDANLTEFLFLEDPSIIPLPSNSPFLDGDSISFVYQQYEIGPYAMGMPAFKIAIKDIKKYMTKEAAALCE